MKLRFPWNMALLYWSRVCFESSRCCFEWLRPVFPHIWMWQPALDKRLILPLAISQIISPQTPRSLNSISPRDDDSTRTIRSMKCVVLVFEDPHGLIWPMIFTMQTWFKIDNLLIQDRRSFAVCRGRVMSRCQYDFKRLNSDFSKPSVRLHLLLLWYIDETKNKIAHKGHPKSDHW
jgi:hypothetical protein